MGPLFDSYSPSVRRPQSLRSSTPDLDPLRYRTILVKLTNSVHFDTPLVDVTLRPQKVTWNFLNVLINDVYHAARDEAAGEADPEHHAYTHDAAVPCVKSYLEVRTLSPCSPTRNGPKGTKDDARRASAVWRHP